VVRGKSEYSKTFLEPGAGRDEAPFKGGWFWCVVTDLISPDIVVGLGTRIA